PTTFHDLIHVLSTCYFTPWTAFALGKEQACIRAAGYGLLEQVGDLSKDGKEIFRMIYPSLYSAAKYGLVEVVIFIVKCLEQLASVNVDIAGSAFLAACKRRHAGVVKVMGEKKI